ncbi:MAG: tetratricopeptide repeat protein [bacterium]
MDRPIFLSGRVIMEDGTPPPDRVEIHRVCNGVERIESYTDSKGRFSFEVGRNAMTFADASIGTGYDPFDPTQAQRRTSAVSRTMGPYGPDGRLNGCELVAVLPGYRSDRVMLAGRRALDNPDVGTIVLHRLGNVEGTVISITSLQAPKSARKAYENGVKANRDKKWPKAQKELEKAVAEYPKYAAAWYELGFALQQQNRIQDAHNAYARALEADAKYIKPYLQLAYIAAGERKWQEVADTTDRMVRLNPIDFPQAYFLNAVANLNLNRTDIAERSAREALERDPGKKLPQIRQILGMVLASRGDYAGAITQLEEYVKLAPEGANADLARDQLKELRQRAAQQGANRPQQQ